MRARHPPCVAVVAVLAVFYGAVIARAQTRAPETDTTHDSNPTRAVFFSIRPELYKPSADVIRTAVIFRYDHAALVERRWLPGRRGVVFRFEVPIAQAHIAGAAGETGLGDAYGQLLLVPYVSRAFAFVAGAGLIVPTATGDLLGAGKWVLAPAAGPVWFQAGRGMIFVKLQNFVAIAGAAGRPDINYFAITPSMIRVFERRWWMMADSDVKIDWLRDRRTNVKSGLQIGRAITPRVAVWAKPEVWWGANRDGRWNLKCAVVWYR